MSRVIRLIIPAGWAKRTHWMGRVVPGDPEMSFVVDMRLFEMLLVFEIQSDRETHVKCSDFDDLRGIRRPHSEQNLHPRQAEGREVFKDNIREAPRSLPRPPAQYFPSSLSSRSRLRSGPTLVSTAVKTGSQTDYSRESLPLTSFLDLFPSPKAFWRLTRDSPALFG